MAVISPPPESGYLRGYRNREFPISQYLAIVSVCARAWSSVSRFATIKIAGASRWIRTRKLIVQSATWASFGIWRRKHFRKSTDGLLSAFSAARKSHRKQRAIFVLKAIAYESDRLVIDIRGKRFDLNTISGKLYAAQF